MSIQLGKLNYSDNTTDSVDFDALKRNFAPHALDGFTCYRDDRTCLLYAPFHTTVESSSESQPCALPCGALLMWDGRLDNRTDLSRQLGSFTLETSTDAAIVCAAYQQWGTRCFERLLGDWALSICDPGRHSLLLAKDPVGTRHLYFRIHGSEVTWSTTLEPIVLLSKQPYRIDEEYIAGWFSFFPASGLTPFAGIESVPPGSFIEIKRNRRMLVRYWNFDPSKQIRYTRDAEYEDHFRTLFRQSVMRRLRSNAPVLAELSGGMDSSSIVCVADDILNSGLLPATQLDTVSYYNDSEPNWNERPYFSKVEQKRRRVGFHINLACDDPCTNRFVDDVFPATPCSGQSPSPSSRLFAECRAAHGNRVVLSGIGGDEITGGLPTPTPELMDLMASLNLGALARQLRAWALNKQRPWWHLLLEAVRGFLPPTLVGTPQSLQPPSWLSPNFVNRHRAVLTAYSSRVRIFQSRPSFQENLSAFEALQRQLHASPLPLEFPYEVRYPFLDRDLLEFMFAIPREQLVRPGQRRSLMRRALAGIVPDELLNRKRKAYVMRTPMVAIVRNWPALYEIAQQMLSDAMGFVDQQKFLQVLEKARCGQEVRLVAVLRTLRIEAWLRALRATGPSTICIPAVPT